jgi:hypothetical protein
MQRYRIFFSLLHQHLNGWEPTNGKAIMSIQNILDGDRAEIMTINPPDVDRFRAIQPHGHHDVFTRNGRRRVRRSIPMLRKTMIVLATAAALTGGLSADAFARGGGGHMGGGGGAHMGGGFGGGHMGGGFGGAHMSGRFGGFYDGFAGRHFAGTRGHFDHDRRLRFGFGPGDYGFYDYGCGYGYPYPYYNRYSCYAPEY